MSYRISIFTANIKRWRYLQLLPLAFTTLHISYGLGFLVGLIKFWDRWHDQHGRELEVKPG